MVVVCSKYGWLRKWTGVLSRYDGCQVGRVVVCRVVVVVDCGVSGTGDVVRQGKVEVCLGVVEGGRLCEESRGWQCRGVVVGVQSCIGERLVRW